MNHPSVHLNSVKILAGQSAASLIAQLSKKHPAPYSYIVKGKGYINRYYSEKAGVAVAAAWVSQIDASDKDWCLLNIEHGNCFIMEVSQGVVIQAEDFSTNEGEALRDYFSAALALADTVYCVSDLDECSDFTALKADSLTQIDSPLSDEMLKRYALKKANVWLRPTLIAAAVVISLMAGSWWFTSGPVIEVNTQQMQVLVDPYQGYRDTMAAATSPHVLLENAKALGAYGALLPRGWTLNDITQSGMSLSMNLSRDREAQGTLSLLNAWTDRHPALKPHLISNITHPEFVIPLTADMQHWQQEIIELFPTTYQLFDVLVLFGWDVMEKPTPSLGAIGTVQWELKQTSLPVHQLSYLAEVLDSLPVVITDLTLRPTAIPGEYHTSLIMSLKGVDRE